MESKSVHVCVFLFFCDPRHYRNSIAEQISERRYIRSPQHPQDAHRKIISQFVPFFPAHVCPALRATALTRARLGLSTCPWSTRGALLALLSNARARTHTHPSCLYILHTASSFLAPSPEMPSHMIAHEGGCRLVIQREHGGNGAQSALRKLT